MSKSYMLDLWFNPHKTRNKGSFWGTLWELHLVLGQKKLDQTAPLGLKGTDFWSRYKQQPWNWIYLVSVCFFLLKRLWWASMFKRWSVFPPSTGQWGGLLRPPVFGSWPAAGTLQRSLRPSQESVGGPGKGLRGQPSFWRGGLWHRDRCRCLSSAFFVVNVFVHWVCLFNSGLSNPQSPGYLLGHFQPGHRSACKHMEVPHQVGVHAAPLSFLVGWDFVFSCNFFHIQTEPEVPSFGGRTSTSRWPQQQPVWQPAELLPQLCGAGRADAARRFTGEEELIF